MDRELILSIQAQMEQAEAVFNRLEELAGEKARKMREKWEKENQKTQGGFRSFFRTVETMFRRFASNAGRHIDQIRSKFMNAFRQMIRAATSLQGILLGAAGVGGIMALGERALDRTFDIQRQGARFRATRRDAAARQRLQTFAQQQAGGAFTEQQVLSGVISARRLSERQLMQLIPLLRNVVVLEGDFAEAVTAVQRAMFEGESELAERFGLLLKEANLVNRANQLYGKRITQLTDAEKANVVFAETLNQLNDFMGLEAEFLQTTAGQWQLLKNRLSGLLLVLGQRMEPLIAGALGLLNDFTNRWEVFSEDMERLVPLLFDSIQADLGRRIAGFFDDLAVHIESSILGAFNRITLALRENLPVWGGFLRNFIPGQIMTPQSVPTTGVAQTPRQVFDEMTGSARLLFRRGQTPSVPSPPTIPLPVQLPGTVPSDQVTEALARMDEIESRVVGRSGDVMAGLENNIIGGLERIAGATGTIWDDVVMSIISGLLTIQQIQAQGQLASAVGAVGFLGMSAATLTGVGAVVAGIATAATIYQTINASRNRDTRSRTGQPRIVRAAR